MTYNLERREYINTSSLQCTGCSEEIADEETSTSKFTGHRPAHPALQPDVLLCDYRALIIKIDMEKVQQLSPEP